MPAIAPSRLEEALQRSAAYALFAHAFAYPDGERIAALREAAADVLRAEPSLPLQRLAAIASEATGEALEPVFVGLTTFSSSPDCPNFETAYYSSEAVLQAQRMADVAGFYRAWGVDATTTGFRPDDLPVELEFMAFLCDKEAYAIEHMGAPRANQARKAQRIFLEEHLGCWGPAFGRRLAERAPAGHFYQLAGQTLRDWLGEEAAAVGARPVPVSGEPAPGWQTPISHGPEFAGNASFVSLDELS